MEVIRMSFEEQKTESISQKVMIKGLDNLGNTCYLNCCLQSLYATSKFREYLLSDKWLPRPLHSSLTRVFKRMNTIDENKSIQPKDFWQTFTEYKPQFEGRQQHDAQECLRFIIDGIHEEVNKAKQRRNKRDKNKNPVIDTSIKAWNHFIKYMDDSYLVHIFVGQLKSTIQCNECHNQSHSWEHFWDISLSLPEKEEDPDVVKCLQLFVEDEVMDSDAMPECSQCKVKRKSTRIISVEKLPIVLVIHLKRFGNNGQKIIKDVKINEDLTIQNNEYLLYACISHRGMSCSGGHYIAHCRHLNTWFFFDDEEVTEMESMDFNELTDAYILFYHDKNLTIPGI